MSKLLLVEDDPIISALVSQWLTRKGHHMLVAIDGPQGVMMARLERPQLIILDMGLPFMDGLQVVKQLKADASTRRIPIIALTAFSGPGDREKVLAAGCDEYFTKPADFPTLLQKIEQLVSAENSSSD